MGKRSEVDAYRMQKRGGKGVINLKTSDKTGQVVSIKAVTEDEQLMFITRNGVVNRQRVDEIRVIGRATQGVRLVNLDDGDVVVDVARVIAEDEEENGDDEGPVDVLDDEANGEGEEPVEGVEPDAAPDA
jgi:DNA gyrase subunit A